MAGGKDRGKGSSSDSPKNDAYGATTHVESYEIQSLMAYEDGGLQSVLTVIAGVQAGQTVPFNGVSLTGGRDPDCELSLIGRGISRTHFLIEPGPGNSLVINDLGSTNGIYVNGEKLQQHTLADGDRIHVGPETVLRYTVENVTEVQLRVHQYEQSIRDDLTGIYNRRYLMSTLAHELAFGQRHDDYVSVVLFDVDNFKMINDKYGHPAGDSVIKHIAQRLAEQLRTEDIIARYGGEEFAVILRGQNEQGAYRTAERLRTFIENQTFPAGDSQLSLTISLGTSTLRPNGPTTTEEMIAEADRNLYEAKKRGKNCTVGTLTA